jgi:hypothetical protein
MRRILAVLVAILLGGFLTAPTAAAHPHPYCGIYWGSLAKSGGTGSPAGPQDGDLKNVRSGRHACYDRLVIDVDGPVTGGYRVQYVSAVRAEGSGNVIPLRGGADLEIVVFVPAYDDNGNSTYNPTNRMELRNFAGYQTFRQAAWGGSFEGQTTLGLGTRARLPFRVLVLAGPGDGYRIVIDVAHRW